MLQEHSDLSLMLSSIMCLQASRSPAIVILTADHLYQRHVFINQHQLNIYATFLWNWKTVSIIAIYNSVYIRLNVD
jgi:hypothetical protein